MKRILPYKLFENKSKVDEKEFESTVTDIFSDFIDDHNLSMHFDWGWVVDNDFRKDSEIRMIRKELEHYYKNPIFYNKNIRSMDKSEVEHFQKYLDPVDKSTTRFVQIMFDKYDRGSVTLNIYNKGIQSDFEKCAEFVRNYYHNAEIQYDNGSNITEKSWAVRFYVIFK